MREILKSLYFIPALILLLVSFWLFPFGGRGIVRGLTEECKSDSIFNYFPQSQVESIFGLKASKISGGMGYTCNGGEAVFNFQIPTGQKDLLGKEFVIPYNLEVRIRKDASAAAASKFFQEITTVGKVTTLTGPSDKKSVLGLGDESVLITSFFRQTGVARKDNFVYVVVADVLPPDVQSLIPLTYPKLSDSAVAQKVKKLLTFAISRRQGAYAGPQTAPRTAPQTATEEFSKLPKTCGEYVDYPKLFESMIPHDKPPSFSQGLPIVKTNGGKYFPAKRIEAIWGKNILFTQYGDKKLSAGLAQSVTKAEQELNKLQLGLPPQPITDKSSLTAIPFPGVVDWVSCLVTFSGSDPVLNSVTLSYIEFDSGQNALNSINLTENQKKELKQKGSVINKVEGSKKIGDGYSYMEGTLLAEGQKESLSFFAVAAVKGKFQAGVLFFNRSDLNKADETLRMILGNLAGEGEAQEDKCATAAPAITSFTPEQVQAGTEKFIPDLEMVDRKQAIYNVVIQGQCLQKAELSNNATFDPTTGEHSDDMPILQTITEVSANGTSVQGQLGVHPDTKSGPATFILKNEQGKTTSFVIPVLISGTQHLERTFPNQGITFIGSWPKIDKNVSDLIRGIEAGQKVIITGGYPKLGITMRIYEGDYWINGGGRQKACPGLPHSVIACASSQDTEIMIGEKVGSEVGVGPSIVHESAHKLHFYNLGRYKPLPSTPTDFDTSWRDLMKDINPSTCSVLPPTRDLTTNLILWKDKSFESRCGFTQPYGANGFDRIPPEFFDDIATYVEDREFYPKALNSSDSASGSFTAIYKSKLELLQKYEF